MAGARRAERANPVRESKRAAEMAQPHETRQTVEAQTPRRADDVFDAPEASTAGTTELAEHLQAARKAVRGQSFLPAHVIREALARHGRDALMTAAAAVGQTERVAKTIDHAEPARPYERVVVQLATIHRMLESASPQPEAIGEQMLEIASDVTELTHELEVLLGNRYTGTSTKQAQQKVLANIPGEIEGWLMRRTDLAQVPRGPIRALADAVTQLRVALRPIR